MDKFSEKASLGIECFTDELIQPSHEIFNHGLSYYRAYLKIKDDPETSNPSYVCLVFSIEIFLKCLETRKTYQKEDSYTDTIVMYKVCDKPIPQSNKHDLKELFKKLSEETQETIKSAYKNECYRDFDEDLTAIAKGFMEWRYIYEGKVEVIYVSALQNIGSFLARFSSNFLKIT